MALRFFRVILCTFPGGMKRGAEHFLFSLSSFDH